MHESIDITLRPEPRFSISGVVVDANGSTPPKVRVEHGNGSSSGTALIGNAGRFDLRGIANGRVHLLASSDSPDGPRVAYLAVDVLGASLYDIRVELGAPASVRGRVIAESGAPSFAGAQVVLRTPWFRAPQFGANPNSRREADSFDIAPDGSFTAAPLIGERIVDVIGLPATWQLEGIRRRGAVIPDRRLTLINGQVIDDLEVIVSLRN
jgi:hypothetical protein